MTARRLVLLLATSTLAIACKSDEPNGELLALIDDYDYERDGSRALLCSCPSELGYASEAECEAGLGDIGPAEKDCIADAFAADEELGRNYLECIVGVQSDYRDCLNEYLACEPDWTAICDQEKDDAALTNCPELPSDAADAFAACF